MYDCTVCSIPPLLTSSADSLQTSNVTRMDTLQTCKCQKSVHAQQNPASSSKKRAISPQKAGMCLCVCVCGRGGGVHQYSVFHLHFSPLHQIQQIQQIHHRVMMPSCQKRCMVSPSITVEECECEESSFLHRSSTSPHAIQKAHQQKSCRQWEGSP